MKAVGFLRVASVLTLIHAVLHTVGGVFGQPAPGPQQAAVSAMQTNTFPIMGVVRSVWSFYRGFGLGITLFLVSMSIVLWQLSSLAKTGSARLRPICWTIAATFLLMAVNSYVYFFWPPVFVESLIAICIVGAIFTSNSTTIPLH